ncbi:MAG: CBS domain-containing protein [Halioglobus sp.]|jgi:signal-transduction protein with cAMP-binding, CBS, and nucleotidyltransferase domain
MQRTVIKARDVMREKHLELDGMATVKEALDAMKAAEADVVIVKKRHENDAFGIVLLSDIAKNVLARDRASQRVNVYEIMSKPVISLDPEMDVRYCARLFDNFGLSNAPVIENGEVVGIVSYNELVFQGLCKLIE